MKKSTFLFSLLLSVATIGLHAQKPESGTYTISNVSNSEATLADNQFLGIGAMNDDGTYQTYSMKMNQSGTTTVFDVYEKIDELLGTLKESVISNLHTGDALSQLTAPDVSTMIQLLSEGYCKINVEATGTTDTEGNPIVRFKVAVPTIPNFVDNAFMTLMGATGARYSQAGKVYLWEYALNTLAQAYASDPVALHIIQTAKNQIKPITYKAYQHFDQNWPLAKCRYYYIYAQEDGTSAFLQENQVDGTNYTATLWTLKGNSEAENIVSGKYFIANKGNGKYINYDGSNIAQPNLSQVSFSTQDAATSTLEVGRLRESENAYQIDNFTVNGKSIFDYISRTISPDATTIQSFTKTAIRSNRTFYPSFMDNYGYIMDYETPVVADWYIKKYGKLKMQDNGDGTVYFYFDLPAMPCTAAYVEYFGSESLWETLKNSTLFEITDADEKTYAQHQLDKLTPPEYQITVIGRTPVAIPPTSQYKRYYIVANENNEFDFVTSADLATAGDNAKWMLNVTELTPLAGYFRIQNTTTGNVLELHGTDISTLKASSDATECITNASTVFSLSLTPKTTDYEVTTMRSQGIEFLSELNSILGKIAEKAGLEEVPHVNVKPVGGDNYVPYFDVPEMTDRQFLAVMALVLNDVKDPAATEKFFSNVHPSKRYSIAQIPGESGLIAVEGDEEGEYNVWQMKEIDNENERFAAYIQEKVHSTEGDNTYYYITLNTDFAYSIPTDGQIVGVYVVPTVTRGIAHPEKVGGPGSQVPANTPVILESLSLEESDNYLNIIPEVTEGIEISDNYLIGTLLAEPVEANGRSRANLRVFNVSSKGVVGFYKYTGEMLVKNKGYLDLSTVNDELVNTYAISYEAMGPTGINNIDVDETNGDDEIYDIQGRKVNNPTKGLYIINGKKVLVR